MMIICVRNVENVMVEEKMKKLKLIMGYDGADVLTKYYLGSKKITKKEFAEELIKRSHKNERKVD